MTGPEARLALAERRIREGEERVARQAAAVERLDRPGQEPAAEKAKEALAIMQTGLALARLCLAVELAWPGDRPDA